MELRLLDGTFSAAEARELLEHVVAVKTNFHLNKIDMNNFSEEDLRHSEKRIMELEDELRKALAYIRSSNLERVSLKSMVVIEEVGEMQTA
jgi:hypothetical protein